MPVEPKFDFLNMPLDMQRVTVAHMDPVAHVAFAMTSKNALALSEARPFEKDEFWIQLIGQGRRHLFDFYCTECKWLRVFSPAGAYIVETIARGYLTTRHEPAFVNIFGRRVYNVITEGGCHFLQFIYNTPLGYDSDMPYHTELERLSFAIGRSLSMQVAHFFKNRNIDINMTEFIKGVLSRDSLAHVKHLDFMGGRVSTRGDNIEYRGLWNAMMFHGAVTCIRYALHKGPHIAPCLLNESRPPHINAWSPRTADICEAIYLNHTALFTEQKVAFLIGSKNPLATQWALSKPFPFEAWKDSIDEAVRGAFDHEVNRPQYPHWMQWLAIIWDRLDTPYRHRAIGEFLGYHEGYGERASLADIKTVIQRIDTIPGFEWKSTDMRDGYDEGLSWTIRGMRMRDRKAAIIHLLKRDDILSNFSARALNTLFYPRMVKGNRDTFLKERQREFLPGLEKGM